MPADNVQPPSETNQFNSPRVLGNYVLEELLGGGEHGSTFKGTKQGTLDAVAIKVFAKSSTIAKALYDSEIKAYRALKGQAGILQHKDDGETDEFCFIVTEFVKEGSLRRILDECPEGMKIEDVIQLFTPIAAAIDRIHQNNIVHRDLKPENILIRKTDRGYQIFVADFGFVKFTGDSKQFQTEKTAGTWKYIPPEAWKADPDTPQTKAVDIYALGVILYEALEGRIPYADIGELLSHKPALSPTRTLQNTDPFVVEYLLKAIHKDPEQRPASGSELMDGIRNAYEGNLSTEQKWIGRKIKNYVVEEVLGAGRMGISLRARDTQATRQVVLKAFTRSLSGNAIQAYDKEKKSLERLENGHGVLIPHDRFEYEGYFFIVTEYQSGGTLRNLLNRRPRLAPNEIMEIFAQIAEAIDYIHEKKVVHRDIKPENIVYSVTDGKIHPFITDFGVSVILASTQSSFRTHEIGTPRYMAPELWDTNARGTKAVDIYAFGIMLYEALEGHAPFDADAPAIIKQHLYLSVPPPEKTLKELGINARNVLLQTLAKDPEERPKTAAEVMQQIKGQHAMFLGKKYGKYIIEKFVGRGTYGATYRAYDRNKNQRKKFAFKVLSIPEPIMQEVDALKKLGHFDGIVPILDGNSENGIHYIVTEYLNGLNLRDMLQSYRQGMSLDDTLKLFKPIARALDHLHNNDVIHGDLKPENIILLKNKNEENSYEPFVTGFGISRIAGKAQSFYAKSNINYIAPELWEDAEPSRSSDIFALGVILYETLVGVPPFDAQSPAHLMKKYLANEQPEVKNLTKLYGKNIVKALLQALNKKSERRQKYALELISGLERRGAVRTPTKAGRVSGDLLTTLHSLQTAFRRNLAASILAVLLFMTWLAFGAYVSASPNPSIPITGSTPLLPTSTVSVTDTPPLPTVAFTAITPILVATSALPPCDLQYSLTQKDCDYFAAEEISLEKLFGQFYGDRLSQYDLYAIAYHNNRKALQEQRYATIDPKSLKIEKGWTILLPALESIETYNMFPRPVMEAMGQNTVNRELTISGSSALEPLSSKIKEGFEQDTEYKVKIKSNNTELGVADFCQSKAQLFGVSEMKFLNCPNVTFLKFEIARYAVVIFINQNNSNWSQLIEEPLNTGELNRLLTSAETWKEVREEFTNDPITRYYPSQESAAFETVRYEIFPTVDPNSILSLEPLEESLIPESVINDDYSIGFASYFTYQNNIDRLLAVSVNRVPPNRDTIQKEIPAYPLTRQLYLYTGEVTYQENPLVRFFINYYLSNELDYLDALGYFPPSRRGFLDNPYTSP
jgi:serine/threonine protein kinase